MRGTKKPNNKKASLAESFFEKILENTSNQNRCHLHRLRLHPELVRQKKFA
jgi:hypothetical protein